MLVCGWMRRASGCNMMRLWNFTRVMFACGCMGKAFAYVEIEDCARCDVICDVVTFPSCVNVTCVCVCLM